MIIIDISSPDGNTLAALGIARRLLKAAGRGDAVEKLTADVMGAQSYRDALECIERATEGALTFVGWGQDERA